MRSARGVDSDVMIPETASEWELYQDMKGVDQAARSLTGALTKALMARTQIQAETIMWERLSRYRRFGAIDTGPRTIAERCLSKGRGGDYSGCL